MFDSAFEWLFIAILLAPVLLGLGTIVARLVGARSEGETVSDDASQEGAGVNALDFVRRGAHHRLRLVNEGRCPARDVDVFVNNKPVTAHRGGASAEEHPIRELGAGDTFSYRYASEDEEGVIVRIEWEDATEGGRPETALEVR